MVAPRSCAPSVQLHQWSLMTNDRSFDNKLKKVVLTCQFRNNTERPNLLTINFVDWLNIYCIKELRHGLCILKNLA